MSKRFCDRFLLTIATAIFGMAFAKAQALHSLSVDDAIALAKKNNIAVKAALTNLAIQEQSNKEITADALPLVAGTAGTIAFFQTPVTLVPGQFFGGAPGSTIAVSFQPKYAASAGATLTQKIFDGSVFVGLKARKSSLDYYKKAIDLAIEDLTVSVYKTYYQLVVSKTQVQFADSNISRAEKLLHDTKVMNENGFAEKLAVDKASVQLSNLITDKHNTETSITNGFLQLKFLIGVPAADSVIVTTEFDEAALRSGIPIDIDYNSYKNRNSYQSLEITKMLSDFDIKRYQSAYYPTASLTGSYQKNAYNNTYDFFSKSGEWYSTSYVGLNINVPIFSGFAKDARLKKARLNASLINDQIENLKLNINLQVANSKNDFINAIQTMDFQKGNMELAESVYNQTKKKFESGLATNTDLSTAQQDLIQAQVNYLNALYTAVVAKVNFLYAVGKI